MRARLCSCYRAEQDRSITREILECSHYSCIFIYYVYTALSATVIRIHHCSTHTGQPTEQLKRFHWGFNKDCELTVTGQGPGNSFWNCRIYYKGKVIGDELADGSFCLFRGIPFKFLSSPSPLPPLIDNKDGCPLHSQIICHPPIVWDNMGIRPGRRPLERPAYAELRTCIDCRLIYL